MNDFCAFAIDDEIAVLGWFISEPSCRRKIASEIRSVETFEPSGLSPLWEMLVEMHAAGSEIDPSVVRREAKKRKLNITDDQHAMLARKSANLDHSIKAIRLAAMRRWMQREGEAIQRAALDPALNPIESATRFHDSFGKAIRVASKIGDRSGAMKELTERLDAMASGRIANLAWPDAPVFTRMARALESGSITMLSGSPGDGKTFWLLQSLIGWHEAGVKVSICMLEKNRAWHTNRIIALLSGNPKINQSEWVEKHQAQMRETRAQYATHIESIGSCITTANLVGETLEQIGRWIDAEADESDIVVVDPISLADAGEKRWLADGSFIKSCIRTGERTGTRLVLVTHPNSTKGGPVNLASLMGGVTYQRATDCVMHVTKLDTPKPFYCIRDLNNPIEMRVMANRTVSVFKGRNGTAGGKRFAFDFSGETMRFVEQGVIVSEDKGSESQEAA